MDSTAIFICGAAGVVAMALILRHASPSTWQAVSAGKPTVDYCLTMSDWPRMDVDVIVRWSRHGEVWIDSFCFEGERCKVLTADYGEPRQNRVDVDNLKLSRFSCTIFNATIEVHQTRRPRLWVRGRYVGSNNEWSVVVAPSLVRDVNPNPAPRPPRR